MNKKIFIAAVAAILILMAATCPGKEEHQEEIQLEVTSQIERLYDDNDALSAFSSLFTSKVVDAYLESKLKVNNYLFFSLGKIYYKGESVGVSFGILHHVFFYGEGKIKDFVDKIKDKE